MLMWGYLGVVMRYLLFWAALICAPAAAYAADEDRVKFAPKSFFDTGAAVFLSGTLTGDGLGYKTNSYSISCVKEMNQCMVASIQAIGDNHIGRMEGPYVIPIIKWTDYEVVAQEDVPLFNCYRTVVTLVRKQQAGYWVEEPVNQTKPDCSKSDGKFRKFTIEDPTYWKKMNTR